jgi:hypothetical protein
MELLATMPRLEQPPELEVVMPLVAMELDLLELHTELPTLDLTNLEPQLLASAVMEVSLQLTIAVQEQLEELQLIPQLLDQD